MNEFFEMSARFAIRVGDDVHLVASSHRDRDVVEAKTWKRDLEDDLVRVVSVDRQFRTWRFRAVVEDFIVK